MTTHSIVIYRTIAEGDVYEHPRPYFIVSSETELRQIICDKIFWGAGIDVYADRDLMFDGDKVIGTISYLYFSEEHYKSTRGTIAPWVAIVCEYYNTPPEARGV